MGNLIELAMVGLSEKHTSKNVVLSSFSRLRQRVDHALTCIYSLLEPGLPCSKEYLCFLSLSGRCLLFMSVRIHGQ